MVEIPDSLRSLFSASLQQRDGTYVIEVPSDEIDQEAVTVDETYRVAVLDAASSAKAMTPQASQNAHTRQNATQPPSGPPVDDGEVRDVTIETVGDQGDGIAKVERGYVVIVPGGQPGDEPTVEIEQVQENVAFASVVDSDSRAL
ncbi:TRAM domain-containing protein [Halostella pelagica]|uniref:TRAM domain-containing protein n=1 Tax=Halostella pelagica TaxID=2583824 RepID=UPI00108181C4|nr:TRAM domain-containing protein [Halostella pelagica]